MGYEVMFYYMSALYKVNIKLLNKSRTAFFYYSE